MDRRYGRLGKHLLQAVADQPSCSTKRTLVGYAMHTRFIFSPACPACPDTSGIHRGHIGDTSGAHRGPAELDVIPIGVNSCALAQQSPERKRRVNSSYVANCHYAKRTY